MVFELELSPTLAKTTMALIVIRANTRQTDSQT